LKTAIIDSSFSGPWFLKDEYSHEAETALSFFLKGSLILWIPSLWLYETTNLLIQAHARSRISDVHLEESFDLISTLSLKIDEPDAMISHRIGRLAQQAHLSAYDAAYLELADRLQAPLLTFDRKLVEACRSRHLQTKI